MTHSNTPRSNTSLSGAKREAELDSLLASYDVTPPSDLLSARILREARATKQDILQDQSVNRVESGSNILKYWPRIAALVLIAFSVGMVTFSTLTPTTTPTPDDAVWLEAANALGMDEIYDWVENESPTIEGAY